MIKKIDDQEISSVNTFNTYSTPNVNNKIKLIPYFLLKPKPLEKKASLQNDSRRIQKFLKTAKQSKKSCWTDQNSLLDESNLSFRTPQSTHLVTSFDEMNQPFALSSPNSFNTNFNKLSNQISNLQINNNNYKKLSIPIAEDEFNSKNEFTWDMLPSPETKQKKNSIATTGSSMNIIQALENYREKSQSQIFPQNSIVHSQINPKNRISSESLTNLMIEENDSSDYLIIDCRYNYEFQSGHIHGSININNPLELTKFFTQYSKHLFNSQFISYLKTEFPEEEFSIDKINQEFISNLDQLQTVKNLKIILHCEFSEKRAPKLFFHCRALCKQNNISHLMTGDDKNIDLLLLENGYSEFYHKYKNLITTEQYISMFNNNYQFAYSLASEQEKENWDQHDKNLFLNNINENTYK